MGLSITHSLVATILGSIALAGPTVAAAASGAAAPAPYSDAANLFAIIYHAGPNYKAELPREKQALREHRDYYTRGAKEGRVFAGGWLVDINGGLAILRMSSFDEAKAFLAADPAVLNGTFVGEVHVWTPGLFAEGAKEALKSGPAQPHQPGS